MAAKLHFFLWLWGGGPGRQGGGGVGEAEKSLPRLVGWQPARPSRPRCRQKKAASYWVEVAGGAGVDKTTHSPPFFPRPELEEEEEEEEKVEEKGLKGRRRRLRISGGSVRLGRTKIARSIRKSQPSPHNRLFQPLSLLLLFLLLQATRPWPEISTGIFSFSSAPLDFSQLGIGHHCWKTDSKLAPAVLSTCNIVAGSGCVDHELGEDQPPSRSPPPQLAFSHPPPCFLFSSISAENPLLAAPRGLIG